jgi:hypothetical protein
MPGSKNPSSMPNGAAFPVFHLVDRKIAVVVI